MSEVVQFRQQPKEPPFGELIDLYLETRDAKTALEKQQKEHLRQYTDVMQKIEGHLMAHLQEQHAQSLSSEVGTAYLRHTRSAPIHDAVAFKNYVIENRAWEMLDWKANVTAVGDFITENEIPPPGVNLKSAVMLGVMRK
jgi:hypothetical protein